MKFRVNSKVLITPYTYSWNDEITYTADNWNKGTDLNFVKANINTILMKINWEGWKVLLESKIINSIW